MHRTKQLIIETTIMMVDGAGLGGAATGKIAQKANIATGTLFHHFKTKQLLIEAAHRYIFDDFIWHLLGFFDYPEEKMGKQLKKATKAAISYWVRNPIFHSFMSQMVNSRFYHDALQREEEEQLEKRLGFAFELAMKKGILKKYSYTLLIRLYIRTVFQVAGLVLAAPEDSREKYKKQGLTFLWSAIAK